MTDLAVMCSSVTDEWATPRVLFAWLNDRYRFTLDPCATPENATCPAYYTADDDGLTQPWAPQRVFMNPPYGRAIGRWMRKAYEEAQRGALVVCLVPARTDTRWWHDYASRAARVRFPRGRLRFGEATSGAPFPSAVVVFEPFRVTAKSPTCHACEVCKRPVLAARSDARYCSPACRQKAYRARMNRSES